MSAAGGKAGQPGTAQRVVARATMGRTTPERQAQRSAAQHPCPWASPEVKSVGAVAAHFGCHHDLVTGQLRQPPPQHLRRSNVCRH